MADTKVSALTDIGTLAAGDKFPVADASDLSVSKSATAREIKEYVSGYTTQATAAGTTTLTVDSTYYQFFTGTLVQDCVLPDATTLQLGDAFYIDNNSTGIVTIKTNGGATLIAVQANNDTMVKVTDISTSAGTWDTNSYADRTAVNTWTDTQTFATGTTTKAPINIPAGTLKTTPSDGDIESDGDAMYACTDAGNRGVIPIEHLIRADATRTFTSNTSQQAIFTTPANGTLTLEVGCYLFEGLIAMDTMSATSGNGKFSLIGAGTATLAAILWHAMAQDAAAEATAAATGGSWHIIATQTAANITTAATGAGLCFLVKGTFEVSVAGTIIPSFAQTTAAAAVVNIGSYIRFNRIGSTSLTSIGQWT